MNLLEETISALGEGGKSPSDVRFVVGASKGSWGQLEGFEWCTWDEFAQSANYNYDSGYGDIEVSEYLKVVGDDWWLERHEYDGSEWWEFKTLPQRPDQHVSQIVCREP